MSEYTIIHAVSGKTLADEIFNHTAHRKVADSELPDADEIWLTMPSTGKDMKVSLAELRNRINRQDWFLWDASRTPFKAA